MTSASNHNSDRRQTLDEVFPGTWALGLNRAAGKKCIEKAHPTRAAERFTIGVAGRDDHLTYMAQWEGNVALHLPERIIAIDCDNTAACELIEQHIGLGSIHPREMRTSASGERKAHVLFRLPDGVSMKSKTKIKLPFGEGVAELDIRGMTKTVIVCAPSTHEDGNHYQWTCPLPAEVSDVPELGGSLLQLLEAAGVNTTPDVMVEERDMGGMPGHDQLRTYINRWAPRLRTLTELRTKAIEAVDRIYADRPARAAEVCEPQGELHRLVTSAWDLYGAASPLDEEMTDKGRALSHRTHFGEIAYYLPPIRKFFRYGGVTWDEVPPIVISHDFTVIEQQTYEDSQWATPGQQRDALASQSRALRTAATKKRATDEMTMLYQTSLNTFDQQPGQWVFSDGTMADLLTQKLHPASPDHRQTRCSGAAWVKGAPWTQWSDFLESRLDDDETYQYFWRLCGMMMMGGDKEDILPFLFGTGGTGKSTAIYVLLKAFGGYGHSGSFTTISGRVRSGGAASPDLYAWRGRRFVALDEIAEGQRLGAVAKSVTGDELISARPLFGDQVELARTWTVLGQGNTEPEADPNDPGLKRRIVEIPFDQVLVKPRGARELKWTLTRPVVLEGVQQWLLEGNRMWQRDGLGSTVRIDAAKAAYWERQDVVGEWVEQCCALGPQLMSLRNELWAHFDGWQTDHLTHNERLSSRVFNERLKHRFGDPDRKKVAGKQVQKVYGVELLVGSSDQSGSSHVPGTTH